MTRWFWGLATPATGTAHTPTVPGSVFMELPLARSRKLSVRVDPTASDEASFTTSASDPGASFIGDLDTDLVVQRDDEVLYRGRIGPTADALDAARHDTQYTAVSYRELLKRRSLSTLGTLSYSAVDQAAIVWALMDYTQGLANGYLGIGRGVGAAGIGITRTVTYGKTDWVFDDIAALAQMDDGFDWNVTPHESATDLRLDMWQDGLRLDKGVILEWGSSAVARAARTFDPAAYANRVYATGDPSAALTPVAVSAADLTTFPGGRFETVTSTTDVVQATLASRAAWLGKTLNQKVPTWQVVLAQGAWAGPDHIWPGDLLTWRVKTPRLDENIKYRVVQLDIEPNDSGGEQVTVSLGLVPPTINRLIAKIVRQGGLTPTPTFP